MNGIAPLRPAMAAIAGVHRSSKLICSRTFASFVNSQTGPLSKLRDPSLLKTGAYVNGEWIEADDGSTFPVENPATGEILAEVASAGTAETDRAIEAAAAAFAGWRDASSEKRADVLRRWYELALENRDDIERIMTAECGKPLAESRGEVTSGLGSIEWFAEEARRVEGETLQHPVPGKAAFTTRSPVGVVGSITPWNFPFAMITRKVSPALAAGCPVVLKPADLTPLTAFALAELGGRAGIPRGVLNVLVGDSAKIGESLMRSDTVRKLGFTGSTRVGKILYKGSADTMKRISLELGGNAPFVVFEDADLEKAAAHVAASSNRNAGQTCICTNRVLVQRSVAEKFSEILARRVSEIHVGDGFEPGVTQGPVISARALDNVERLVNDAVACGARALVGGKRTSFPEGSPLAKGHFFDPTVLVDVPTSALIWKEEIFGPVTPVYTFEDEDEAVAMANDTEYGLAAYLATESLSRAHRVASRLESGMVGVNESAITSYVLPFGGVKHSGLGREHSKHGIAEYLDIKTVVIGL